MNVQLKPIDLTVLAEDLKYELQIIIMLKINSWCKLNGMKCNITDVL
jgi:hypothetical protein